MNNLFFMRQRWQEISKLNVSPHFRWFFDLVALLGIGGFAWRHGGFLLRDDLYLYGDHPGQFYRLWQLLAVVWPEESWFISWVPYWHAGHPELQFYPPGFALLGWLIWMISFQQLSLFMTYQILVFLSFILPAITFYLLMAWGVQDRLAGGVAALLTMTAPFHYGGILGTIIGIIGERLAFGLMAALVLSGIWLMQIPAEKQGKKKAAILVTGFILGCILLLHPYQMIVPTGVLILYALSQPDQRKSYLNRLLLAILVAFGWTAFWWVPLGVRRDFYISVIDSTLTGIQAHFADMWRPGMGWLLMAALLGSLWQDSRYRRLRLAILAGGAGMLGFIFFDYLILVQKFNFFALDPVRLTAGVTFALFIGLALGVSELSWLAVRLLSGWRWEILGLPFVILVPWFIYSQVSLEYDFVKWMRKWQPVPERTPVFLSEAEAEYELSAVWEVMAQTPGRVLFTSHYGLLFDISTSLKAATPFLTGGTEIIGGTFTHRTPVHSYLWAGDIDPPTLRGKVENEDDQRLMGVAWENMSDDLMLNLIQTYNITLIGTTATDVKAQTFLETSSHFVPVWSNWLFTFYQPVDYEPAWLKGKGATAILLRRERTSLDIQITEAQPGATLIIKNVNYDLWQAEANGNPLPIKTDRYALMKLDLPPGSYEVQLRYQAGWPEQIGKVISLLTFLTIIILVVRRQ